MHVLPSNYYLIFFYYAHSLTHTPQQVNFRVQYYTVRAISFLLFLYPWKNFLLHLYFCKINITKNILYSWNQIVWIENGKIYILFDSICWILNMTQDEVNGFMDLVYFSSYDVLFFCFRHEKGLQGIILVITTTLTSFWRLLNITQHEKMYIISSIFLNLQIFCKRQTEILLRK
jgi:hypothetical protein